MEPARPIPMTLVTGFLGAGKTSLVSNMLKQLDPALRVALVQNDYAAAGIDTGVLEQTGREFRVLEINNGSVFCVCLLGSFIPSLSAFLDENQPDILLLEATGMADPIAIAEILQDPGLSQRVYLSSICCVVDAVNYMKLSRVNLRVKRQIQVADYILLNKMDLLDAPADHIINELKQINPGAVVEQTSWSRFDGDYLLESMAEPQAIRKRDLHSKADPLGRSDIRTLILKTSRRIHMKGLQIFISEHTASLIRVKGYVLLEDETAVEVQQVFGKTLIRPAENYSGQTELVGLGWGIESRDFGRKFHEIRKQFSS